MTRIGFLLTLLATALVALAATPAQAQRTYTAVSSAVSAIGSPTPTGQCGSISSPCHTLQTAFNATANGGEIDVLTPGDYGSLTITHAVSIQGHGWATVTAPNGGTAITVIAGGADNINLRGMLLDGGISGYTGILFNSGATLNIQDSVIRNFYGGASSYGIYYFPTSTSQLFVSNTVVSDSSYGILVNSDSGANAVLDNVAIENNPQYGLVVSSANAMVRNCKFADNGTGLYADTSGTIYVTRTTIEGNSTGWGTHGGSVLSYGDNNIDNNGGGGDGAPPHIPYK